jgi:hypothetical protein
MKAILGLFLGAALLISPLSTSFEAFAKGKKDHACDCAKCDGCEGGCAEGKCGLKSKKMKSGKKKSAAKSAESPKPSDAAPAPATETTEEI